MTSFHLAQLNVARPVAALDDPAMADFMNNLERLNALVDEFPGFVWRLRDEDGQDATSLRPFGPELMINMSVWEGIEPLREYTYQSGHLELLRRRREFFDHEALREHQVLWWLPAGQLPTLAEAWQRLDLLARQGPGPEAFTFRHPHPAPAVV